jgi:hypothetical protein
MRRIFLSGLAAFSLSVPCLRSATPVEAGTAVRYDVAGLVRQADLVVEGRVVAQRVVQQPNGRIETESTLAVARTFSGEHVATRAIRLPGGVLSDGRGMIVPGVPSLALGEEALLFLSCPNADGMRMPVGLAQGRFRIVVDPAGARRLVRDQRDLVLVDANGRALAEPPASATFDYATVVREIESAVLVERARKSVAGSAR